MPVARRVVVAGIATAILRSLAQADDPQRALWLAIKRQLSGPDGEDYFKSNVEGSELPRLKGSLISALINPAVIKLVLGLTDAVTPEVTLTVHSGDAKVKSEPKPGTEIEFVGIGSAFTQNPFMLTFDTSISGIKKGLDFETKKPDSKKSAPRE